MRNEIEMYDLILEFAKSDERIRAVLQNGSRSNPNVPKDNYQDYDIVYIVTDVESFTKDHSFIDVFGKRLMLQMPQTMRYAEENEDEKFVYLMLFEDGNRIDLSLVQLNEQNISKFDCLTKCLLDKDGIIPANDKPSDKDFWIKPPSKLFYDSCCNDFFWCMQNVAKGIVRDELPYAMEMYNNYVRENLNDMVSWYIGIKCGFEISTGKMGKYFKRYLPSEIYHIYQETYSDSNYENFFNSIFKSCELFRTLAKEVGNYFSYTYNKNDDDNMMIYLNRMK